MHVALVHPMYTTGNLGRTKDTLQISVTIVPGLKSVLFSGIIIVVPIYTLFYPFYRVGMHMIYV